MDKHRILIVDQDEGVRAHLRDALGNEFDIDVAQDVPGAVEQLSSRPPSCLLTDLDLPAAPLPQGLGVAPVVSGVDLVAIARGLDSTLPVLILSEVDRLQAAVEAMRLGAHDYVMKPLSDIAELRRSIERAIAESEAERQNTRMLDDLKEAARFKSTLMRSMSHDFKNLVTVVMGYARLAQMHPEQPVVTDCLDHITETSRMMATMAEDLSTYSQIDARNLQLDLHRISLQSCVRAAVKALLYDTALHSIELPEHDVEVVADPARTTQILTNLLGNAIKYSPRGGKVRVTFDGSGEQVAIGVSDQGLGIPADQVDKLFRPFFRLRRDLENGIPGTGLGLAIVQSLVEAHNGSIQVRSREGEGTTFLFTLQRA